MTNKRQRDIRISILMTIGILSLLSTVLIRQARGIDGSFDINEPGKLIVSVWDCVFTGLLLFGLSCILKPVRELFGIQFHLLEKKEKLYLLLSFVIYVVWTVSFTNTMSYGPDEYMRNDIPKFIFSYGSLPYGWEESIRNPYWGTSYGFNIQLPYLLSAYCMNLFGLFTESETILLFASRLSSLLSMVGVTFFAMCISKKIYQNNPIRWVFIILISISPQLVFISSYQNLDAFSLLSAMMIIFAWIQCFEKKWDYSSAVHLAIALAVCLLSYEFSYGYVVMSFVLYCIWSFQNRKEKTFRIFIIHGLVILGIVLIICGWKYIRNAILYDGDIFSLNASKPYAEKYAMEGLKPSERQTIAGEGTGIIKMLFTTPWVRYTFMSSFGVFGYMNIYFEEWIYRVYKIMILTGAGGFILSLFYREQKSKDDWLIRIGVLFSGLFAILISAYYSWCSDFQPQGRYIIVSLPCIFLCITTGYERIAGLITKRWKSNGNALRHWFCLAIFLFVSVTMTMGYISCLNAFGFMSVP